jgi:hypothetical protein
MTLLLVAAAPACGYDGIVPARSVLRTRQFMAVGDQNFSLSPDGHFLLFVSSVPADGIPKFSLVDLNTLAVTPVEGPIEPPTLRPLVDVGTWSGDSRTVFVRGDANSVWAIDVSAPSPRLRRSLEPILPPPTVDPGVVFRQISRREIAVVDASSPTHVYARHRVDDALRFDAVAAYPVRSSDGRWLSYIVAGTTGSFIGRGDGYVLDTRSTGTPIQLEGNVVGPIRFDARATRAYAVRRASGGDVEVVEWHLDRL